MISFDSTEQFDFACGSLFFDLTDSFFFEPLILLKKEKNICSIEIRSKKSSINQVIKILRLLRSELKESLASTEIDIEIDSINLVPNFEVWKGQINNLKLIIKNKSDKLVLSRRVELKTRKSYKDQEILNKFSKPDNKNSYEFILSTSNYLFYSISPETLFLQDENVVEIEAIAGTTTRADNSKDDRLLFNQLTSDIKESREHEAVCDFIKIESEKKGYIPKLIKSKVALKLDHIQHIYSLFRIDTKSYVHPFELIETYHPTPAVGGNIGSSITSKIESIEKFNRRHFAGPSGYINNKNFTSEFLVAIRTLSYDKNVICLNAGAGILKDSSAKKEWTETANKMQNFTKNILHNKVDILK